MLDTLNLIFLHPPCNIPLSEFESPISPIINSCVCDDCWDQLHGCPSTPHTPDIVCSAFKHLLSNPISCKSHLFPYFPQWVTLCFRTQWMIHRARILCSSCLHYPLFAIVLCLFHPLPIQSFLHHSNIDHNPYVMPLAHLASTPNFICPHLIHS